MLCEFKKSTEKVGLRNHPEKTKILSNQSSDTEKIVGPGDHVSATGDDRNQKSNQGCLDNSPVQAGAKDRRRWTLLEENYTMTSEERHENEEELIKADQRETSTE